MPQIVTAAVIGAGAMGSGIAALLANAGVATTLFDIDAERALAGIERQRKSVAVHHTAATVRVGAVVTDLALVADADWIVEAAAERIEIKCDLLASVNAVRKPGSIVSSTTSTFLLSRLTEGMRPEDARDVLITHFFNPPRVQRLVELVRSPATRPDALQTITRFITERLDKRVVECSDTPGFIANRIGTFWLAAALHEAINLGLTVEAADAVLGAPAGAPVGPFAFADYVGIDLLPSAWGSMADALPKTDAAQAYLAVPPIIARMIAEGRHGRKTNQGFMRRRADSGFDVMDLASGAYRPKHGAADFDGDLAHLMQGDSLEARYARTVLGGVLAYACALVPGVAATPDLVDIAMRDGYGWNLGPFELRERLDTALNTAPA
ncbi:MAG TPA: 3-hydroxyacyl-CoA dehydrogenase NAD-binding domain-containing protein [Caulobacteraceae bacterium]|jgi:3-hydroxyacyl-CoA dehydrogenase|nr:3-hydroxyacyl-CoA dehydrogenase NAD-binding domain-containing protein [Caulobacteraceae bacterium]